MESEDADSSYPQYTTTPSYPISQHQQQCYGVHLQTDGFLYSPNYPDNYEINEHCLWRVNTPDGDSIFFHFLDYQTEELFDVVKIGYGTSPSTVTSKVYEYSGDTVPDHTVLYDQDMWIEFKSDNGNNFRGFKLELTAGE